MINNTSKKAVATDLFAQIAASFPANRHDLLQEPACDPLPCNALPINALQGNETRRPKAPRIETVEEMQQALAALKERMSPFLSDFSPQMPQLRKTQLLQTFQWRIETPADRTAFESALKGDGQWDEVRLPHYGPPLGIATTLYRKEFTVSPEVSQQEKQILCFDAVDYTCEVYLNGVCLATHEGFFEPFEIDASDYLRPDNNVLTIRVHNDFTMLGEAFQDTFTDGDKIYAATGLGYDDPQEGWHHCPAGMGIWQKVRLEGRARIAVTDIFVRPLQGLQAVDVELELTGYSTAKPEAVSLEVAIYGRNFETQALCSETHKPGGQNVRGFGDLDHGTPDFEPALIGRGSNTLRLRLPLPSPRLWEPDTPWLYQLQVRLLDQHGKPLDTSSRQFGMRSFEQITDESSQPLGRFELNGCPIRLRGANTMGNVDMCVFKDDTDQLHEDILLAKLTNMNFLRLTQHPVQREVYEACDRLGLMLQTDLPMFATIRNSQFLECVRQAGAMEKLVRCHPSSIIVSFINEPFPASRGKPHRFISREEMEIFFDMARKAVLRRNPDRVIKNVDGDYDPPTREGMPDNHCYCGWYIGHGVDLGYLHHGGWMPVKPGWHYGCGEFGSEGLDPLATMQEFYPQDWLPKTLSENWSPLVIPRAQSGPFHYLWYPTPHSIEEWVEASQRHQEWITRIMTESFRRKSGMNTFAIHLFIDAWPAGWMKTIMDVNRTPKRAWFTYRDALEPLAVFLRTDRCSGFAGEQIPVEVWIANDTSEEPDNLHIRYDISCNGKILHSGQTPVKAARCAPLAIGTIPTQLPHTNSRQQLEVGATLMRGNTPVHESTVQIEVFPAKAASEEPVCVLQGDKPALNLLEQAGILPCTIDSPTEDKTILITSYEAYLDSKPSVDAAVRGGATALLLNMPEGSHSLGNSTLSILPAGMGPRHFASLAPHPFTRDLRPQDVKFWFDETKGYVSPLLNTVLEASGWTPILNTGNGDWQNPWHSVPAAAETADGAGRWRVCQVSIEGRIRTNPVAHSLLLKFLNREAPAAHAAPQRTIARKA